MMFNKLTELEPTDRLRRAAEAVEAVHRETPLSVLDMLTLGALVIVKTCEHLDRDERTGAAYTALVTIFRRLKIEPMQFAIDCPDLLNIPIVSRRQ